MRNPAAFRSHIDRIRGTFALLVMLGHAIDVTNVRSVTDYALPLLLTIRPYLGFVWVVGFIVLSGFCITSSSMRAAGTWTLREYALLRVSRLYPLLWASLLLAVVVETVMLGSPVRPPVWTNGIGNRTAIIQTALGVSGFGLTYGSLAPAYTLSIELVFYVLWGLAWVMAAHRPRRAFLAAGALPAVLLTINRFVTLPMVAYLGGFVALMYTCWLVGAGTAIWFNSMAGSRIARVIAPFRWILLIGVVLVGHATMGGPGYVVNASSIVYYLSLAVAFAFVTIGFAVRGGADPHPLDRWLGQLSYPIFLVHGPMVVFGGYWIARLEWRIPSTLYLAIICGGALAIAVALNLVVEQPVMALRQRLRARPQQDTDRSAALYPSRQTVQD